MVLPEKVLFSGNIQRAKPALNFNIQLLWCQIVTQRPKEDYKNFKSIYCEKHSSRFRQTTALLHILLQKYSRDEDKTINICYFYCHTLLCFQPGSALQSIQKSFVQFGKFHIQSFQGAHHENRKHVLQHKRVKETFAKKIL